jgi:hypothetical protein
VVRQHELHKTHVRAQILALFEHVLHGLLHGRVGRFFDAAERLQQLLHFGDFFFLHLDHVVGPCRNLRILLFLWGCKEDFGHIHRALMVRDHAGKEGAIRIVGGAGAVIHSGLSGQDGKQKRRNERKDSQRGGTHNFFSQIGREPRNAVAGPHNEGPSGAYRQPYMRCNYFLSGPPVRTSAPHLAPHKIAVTDYGVPRNRGQGFDKGKSLRWERDGFR